MNQIVKVNDRIKSLGHFLAAGQKQFSMALPQHMTADRMIRVALTAATKTPKLLDCTPASFALALLNASALGLEPNGRDAHLIPYGNVVQLIPDYKGLVQLAYRSGQVTNIKCKAVREKDHFEYKEGSEEYLSYRPSDEDKPGDLTHAWAMAFLVGGGKPFVVLNRREVMKRKLSSKGAAKSDSPWNTHEDAMWAKSALRELSKFIPQTAELVRALDLDSRAEQGISQMPAELEGSVFDASDVQPQDDSLPEAKQLEDERPKQSRTEAVAGRTTTKPKGNQPEPPPSLPKSLTDYGNAVHKAKNADEVRALWEKHVNKNGDLSEDEFSLGSDFRDWKLKQLGAPAQGQLIQ